MPDSGDWLCNSEGTLLFLLALLIAFLDFLPFFGTGTALIPWALYKLLVKDYRMSVGLIILYGVTQLVRQLIQPKLVGDSMGMQPLPTFCSYILDTRQAVFLE